MEPQGTQRKVLVFDSPEKVALAAAEKFVAYAQEAIKSHDVFSVALAGGNTPGKFMSCSHRILSNILLSGPEYISFSVTNVVCASGSSGQQLWNGLLDIDLKGY